MITKDLPESAQSEHLPDPSNISDSVSASITCHGWSQTSPVSVPRQSHLPLVSAIFHVFLVLLFQKMN